MSHAPRSIVAANPPDAPALPGRWIGERGWCVDTGDATLDRFAQLQASHFPELDDVIPADGSLLLVLKPGAVVSAALRDALSASPAQTGVIEPVTHTLHVRYGGDAGPDLARLADLAGLDTTAFVACHCAAEYTVAFLGFQPGFPYLRGLPAALHAARRPTPRVRVPAGSVAIGGVYTGIYPSSGPGGWQIVGRTTAVMFDPRRPDPALVLPGDRVRFVADD